MHSYSFDNDTEQLNPDMLDVVSPENKFLGKIALTGKETIWEAWLKTLLREDEALMKYTINGDFICKYGIIPANQNVENLQTDCLKNTLHRIINAKREAAADDLLCKKYSVPELVHAVLGADQKNPESDENDIIELDNGYRIHGVIRSVSRVPLSAVSLQQTLYERYKLLWIMDYGFSLSDIFAEWRKFCGSGNIDSSVPNEDAFDEWECDDGFCGALYPWFGEFVEKEYQRYDERLFSSESEKEEWKKDQPEK